MRRLTIALLLVSSPALAGESVIVLSDNSVIRTKSGEAPARMGQFQVETVELKDPAGDADCFDHAVRTSNRRDRYTRMNKCLDGDTVMGVLA